MLNHIQRAFIKYGFAIQRRLFVYETPDQDTHGQTGVKATIFGASGILGSSVASRLGQVGSSIIMPVTSNNQRYYQHIKELKVRGATNKSWIQYDADLRDQAFIQNMVSNSNVVINCVGPRKSLKNLQDFQHVNIEIAERIALACKKKGVLRLIHVSAAAAYPDSPSLDFQTKFYAQQVVKKAFPDVTIIRPCTLYGLNDSFASILERQSRFFLNRFLFVYDDLTTLKQPIREHDVSRAIMNALKINQTKGKTYQIGGPHQLTTMQIHQIVFNTLRYKPRLAYINPQYVMPIAKRIYNWQFFGEQVIRKKTIPEIVSGQHGTIQDLCVQPVSFKNGIFEIMRENIIKFMDKDVDDEN